MEIGTQITQIDELERICASLKQAKIRYIELGPEILPSLPPAKITRLSRFLKSQGITVYSVHAPFGEEADLSAPDKDKRRRAVVSHKKIIKRIKEFGCGILVIHPGEEAEEERLSSRFGLFSNNLGEILPLAEENKITLALENMPPGFVGSSSRELRHIIEGFNSSHLRICFDTGHSYLQKSLRSDFDTLKPYILTFHIHDNDGLRDLHLQPPYGTIPWKNFILWVKYLSFPHPLIMECFPWGKVEFEWVKKEIELLFQGKIIQATSSPPGYIRCPACGHFFFEQEGEPVCYCSFKKS